MTRRTFFILGASKGFGKEVLKAVCLREGGFKLTVDDTIILLGRNLNVLSTLKDECKINCRFQCFTHHLEMHDNMDSFVFDRENEKYYVIYNSASCDYTGSILNIDYTNWHKSMNENVWNMCNFSLFMAKSVKGDIMFINITSLAAIEPIKDLGMYSLTKSYREQFFKVLTLENPRIRVLNYAPGPMDTDFVKSLRLQLDVSSETERMYENIKTWVIPSESANKLIDLIETNSWENNAHIDFYDTPAPMVSFTRSSLFCSSHIMENCCLSIAENKKCFGKCNSLHGHNYVVLCTYRGPIDIITGMCVDLGEIKNALDQIIDQMDHSHLNDLTHFFKGRPTSCEVISVVFWEQLPKQIGLSV